MDPNSKTPAMSSKCVIAGALVPFVGTFPQELLEAFVDQLQDDKASLRACSLASRKFLLSCRKYLFYALRFDLPAIQSNPTAFRQIFEENPQLGSFVRDLELYPNLSSSNHVDLLWILDHCISQITSLDIFQSQWSAVNPNTRWAIDQRQLKLQGPTLTRLAIHGHFTEIPVSIFEGLTRLKQLELSYSTWSPSPISGPVPRPEQLCIEPLIGSPQESSIYNFLAQPSPPFLVDDLKEFTLRIAKETDLHLKTIFLPRVRHLRSISMQLYESPVDLSTIVQMRAIGSTLQIGIFCYISFEPTTGHHPLVQTLGSLNPAKSPSVAITVKSLVHIIDGRAGPWGELDDLVVGLHKAGLMKKFEMFFPKILPIRSDAASEHDQALYLKMPKSTELGVFVVSTNGGR
ncbi:hypothetical protein BDN72DRAFT_846090 [Pluteus cervinus]|uniref:Uncharacterized protein n=1 Tax=Pluteus cervinus TaxID=181527 RepID=A0ACD3AGN9_9AGAR|nr:hypothetical protein BDN72DRAFT_846090 [Pluteus cervinus]